MSLLAALVLTASAPAEPARQAPAALRATGASATASAEARIIIPAIVRLGEGQSPAAASAGSGAQLHRQHRISGRRHVIAFD